MGNSQAQSKTHDTRFNNHHQPSLNSLNGRRLEEPKLSHRGRVSRNNCILISLHTRSSFSECSFAKGGTKPYINPSRTRRDVYMFSCSTTMGSPNGIVCTAMRYHFVSFTVQNYGEVYPGMSQCVHRLIKPPSALTLSIMPRSALQSFHLSVAGGSNCHEVLLNAERYPLAFGALNPVHRIPELTASIQVFSFW